MIADRSFYRLVSSSRGEGLLYAQKHGLGVKTFKRKVLGFCKSSEVFTQRALARRLVAIGMSDSLEEGLNVLDRLAPEENREPRRYNFNSGSHLLEFRRLANPNLISVSAYRNPDKKVI